MPHTVSEGQWLASQYDRPDLGEGIVVAFRRRFCPTPAILVQPRALDPGATYDVELQSTGARVARSGRDLARGLEIALKEAPAHEVVRYQRRRL